MTTSSALHIGLIVGLLGAAAVAVATARPPSRLPDATHGRRRSWRAGWSATDRRATISGVGGVAVGLATASVALGLALIVVVAAWPRLHRQLRLRRTTAHITALLPDTVELLVLFIHAGLTPHQAVRAMAVHAPPMTAPGFAAVGDRLGRGDRLADALAALPQCLGPAYGPVADSLALAERYGLPLAPILDQLALDARDARRRRNDAEARKLPVRLSFPLVACTLPAFVMMAIVPALLAAISSLDTSW